MKTVYPGFFIPVWKRYLGYNIGRRRILNHLMPGLSFFSSMISTYIACAIIPFYHEKGISRFLDTGIKKLSGMITSAVDA